MASDVFRICTFCLMDTTDPLIEFDENGECNHCRDARQALATLPKGKEAEVQLSELVDMIKKAGKGVPYDCIIGLSGGADSSYLLHCAKDWGLRPLLFHVDGGWNSAVADENIKKLVARLGFDAKEYKVDWEEMKDLQRAFLAAGVPNQDIPQDHLFFATLFRQCRQYGIKYWLSGSNQATESILPSAWGYNAMDGEHVRAIHKQFGNKSLHTFPVMSFYEYCRFYLDVNALRQIHTFTPLNLLHYDIFQAKLILRDQYEWQDYGKKHCESRFTKYFQGCFLPTRFGFDKRKAHLSSLIVSDLLSREDACTELAAPLYQPEELENDTLYICNRLGYTREEWHQLLFAPVHSHQEYATSSEKIKRLTQFFRLLGKVKRALKKAG